MFAGRDIAIALREAYGVVSASQREVIITAAYFVAAADGEVNDEEKKVITAIGTALGLELDDLDFVQMLIRKEFG